VSAERELRQTAKISAARIAPRAYQFVFRHKWSLTKVSILPAVAMAFFSVVHHHVPETVFRIDTLAYLLALSVSISYLATAALRFSLTGKDAGLLPPSAAYGQCMRGTIHGLPWAAPLILSPLLGVLLTGAAYELASIATGTNQWPDETPFGAVFTCNGAVLVIWHLLAGRLLLILPSIAAGQRLSIRQSLRITAGQGLRISAVFLVSSASVLAIAVIAYFVASYAMTFLQGVFEGFMEGWRPDAPTVVGWNPKSATRYVAGIFTAVVGTALFASTSALIYQHLVERPRALTQQMVEAFD